MVVEVLEGPHTPGLPHGPTLPARGPAEAPTEILATPVRAPVVGLLVTLPQSGRAPLGPVHVAVVVAPRGPPGDGLETAGVRSPSPVTTPPDPVGPRDGDGRPDGGVGRLAEGPEGVVTTPVATGVRPSAVGTWVSGALEGYALSAPVHVPLRRPPPGHDGPDAEAGGVVPAALEV